MSILINLPTFTKKEYADKATAEKIRRQLVSQYKAVASKVTIKECSVIECNEMKVWQVIRIEMKNGTWARFAVKANGNLAFTFANTCNKSRRWVEQQGCKTADELIAKLQTI